MTLQENFKACLQNCRLDFIYRNITWWVLLTTAVLAIAAFSILTTTTIHSSGMTEIIIFIVTCWICSYIGLNLIKNSRLTPILFERVTLSEPARQRCINMVSLIEMEITKWKQRYDNCEAVFMSLSKQPAWDYLDEIVKILSRIKQSAEQDAVVAFPEIKMLNDWVGSSKPRVIEGYLDTLESVYTYAKAEYTQQGKNIEELYPELGKGHTGMLVNALKYTNNFAHELLDILKKEHPILAQTNLGQIPLPKTK